MVPPITRSQSKRNRDDSDENDTRGPESSDSVTSTKKKRTSLATEYVPTEPVGAATTTTTVTTTTSSAPSIATPTTAAVSLGHTGPTSLFASNTPHGLTSAQDVPTSNAPLGHIGPSTLFAYRTDHGVESHTSFAGPSSSDKGATDADQRDT